MKLFVPPQRRIDFPGAIHHLMNRGEQREDIHHDDLDRPELVKRMRWTAADLEARRKSGPGKLRLVVRSRKKTVLGVNRIAAQVHLGSYHTAKANLYAWLKQGNTAL